jgi:hypothetical protein
MQRIVTFLAAMLDTVAAPGRRKLAVLAPAMAVAETACVAALFSGHMTAEQFHACTLDILQWGGGIFVVGNIIEHGTKAAMPADKP